MKRYGLHDDHAGASRQGLRSILASYDRALAVRPLCCSGVFVGSAPRRCGSLVEEDSTQRVVD